ncbi:hypothetical protein [Streptomyces noursei]|uniref:hypothetical protein n=1 Tax=Streptomyces noursei TaxID=1971 RepID=UPI000AE2A17A|nr:hypothetical protein [Streptomyces noursei]
MRPPSAWGPASSPGGSWGDAPRPAGPACGPDGPGPAAFWQDLRAAGLVSSTAPLPNGA